MRGTALWDGNDQIASNVLIPKAYIMKMIIPKETIPAVFLFIVIDPV
tara:strand:- start:227 stop:367 length:141 start_codon:yes stop_codon:yes gene_type:complete